MAWAITSIDLRPLPNRDLTVDRLEHLAVHSGRQSRHLDELDAGVEELATISSTVLRELRVEQ